MKLNWTAFKIVLAFMVIVGVIFWAVDSVRSRSYSGANLSFDVAGGLISVTNPSEQSVAAQFKDTGFRAFEVSSSIEGVTGSSIREGSGNTRIQQFAFDLPPGTSEFTISRGTNVSFAANTGTELQATMNPMSSEASRNTFVAAVVVVFGVLFYISNITQHQLMRGLRSKVSPSKQASAAEDTKPTPVVRPNRQGDAMRAYGDNRAEG